MLSFTFTSSTWTHRAFFLQPPGESFDWLPVTSSLLIRRTEGPPPSPPPQKTPPPGPSHQPQRQTSRPNPSNHGAGLHCTTRIQFNINEVAHWLRLASIPLRDFCRLADFLQYYFWGSRVKVLKNVADPQHWDGLNGGDVVSEQR